MRSEIFERVPYIEGENIILKEITFDDVDALREMTESEAVYKYLPTFLLERQYKDMHTVIEKMYGECFLNCEALFLGVYLRENGDFCGMVELYGYNAEIFKISIGYRLLEKFWGMGIASEAVALTVDHLYSRTDIQIITASTMPKNKASEKVLKKNGFDMVVSMVGEDWGYPEPTPANKWIR